MAVYVFHVDGVSSYSELKITATDERTAVELIKQATLGGTPLVTEDNFKFIHIVKEQ
jgi:hypothetical protein